MHLHDLETGLEGALRSRGEVGLHLLDAGGVERLRYQPTLVDGLRAGRDDGPGPVAARDVGLVKRTVAVVGPLHARLRTRMGELDAGRSALGLHEPGDLG